MEIQLSFIYKRRVKFDTFHSRRYDHDALIKKYDIHNLQSFFKKEVNFFKSVVYLAIKKDSFFNL